MFDLLTKLSKFTKLQLHISSFKKVLDEKSCYFEWKQIPFCEIAQFCQKGIQQWFLFQPDSELKSESSESFNFLEKSDPTHWWNIFVLTFSPQYNIYIDKVPLNFRGEHDVTLLSHIFFLPQKDLQTYLSMWGLKRSKINIGSYKTFWKIEMANAIFWMYLGSTVRPHSTLSLCPRKT